MIIYSNWGSGEATDRSTRRDRGDGAKIKEAVPGETASS